MTTSAVMVRACLANAALPAILLGLIFGFFVFLYSDQAPVQILRFLGVFLLAGLPYSIVHELGHAISGCWYGVPPRRIRIGSCCAFRIGRAWGISLWYSFLPFGGRTDFRVHPLERGRRIVIYAAGVGVALITAVFAVLIVPATCQWLRIDIVITVIVFCMIDLFGKAPEGDCSDGEAIRGLLGYSRRL